MQSSNSNSLSAISHELGEVFSSPYLRHRQHLLEVILLGSMTTGEMCRWQGTSDIDLLLIMRDEAVEDDCSEIKEDVRQLFSKRRCAQNLLGLRCRYVGELAAFWRYLALQGYHSSYALPMCINDGVFRNIPDFQRQPARKEEFLCILGECLWGELRARARSRECPKKDSYYEAKVLLNYLNLLLVADGVFLPTHKERAHYWNESRRDGMTEIIVAAVEAKTGVSLERGWQQLRLGTDALRALALNRWSGCQTAEQGMVIDPAIFWIAQSAITDLSERANISLKICNLLAKVIADNQQGTVDDKELLISPGSRVDCQLLHFLESCHGESYPLLVEKIQAFRIAHSEASRRDWGDIHFSIQTPEIA